MSPPGPISRHRPPRGAHPPHAVAAVIAAVVGGATAGAEPPPPDKPGFSPANPTPRGFMRPMSTDRPDTTESPHTVEAGRVQVELSFVDVTHDRDEETATESLAVAPVLLKIGLSDNADLQLGFDPYVREKSTDRAANASETIDGFGDTTLRLKINLWGNDGGDTAFALMPFVTLPTASDGLGSAHVEGGLILPFAVAVGERTGLGFMAELDLNRSGDGERTVVDFVHTATIGHDLTDKVGVYAEYAGFANLNHDEPYRAYLDAGMTYSPSDDVQYDAGVRIGLNREADDLGLFAGVSFRF